MGTHESISIEAVLAAPNTAVQRADDVPHRSRDVTVEVVRLA